jgi:hypothetical protein
MFSWICPQCGREVPPSYTECPDCAAKGKVPPSPGAEPAQPQANVPPGPEMQPQPPYFMQPPQGAAPYPNPAGAAPTQYAPYPQQYGPTQYPPQYGTPAGQYPQYPPPPQQYQPPPQYQAPPRQYTPPAAPGGRHIPTWLMTVVFAAIAGALLYGLYSLVGSGHTGSQAAAPPAAVENPAAAKAGANSPLQKYIEISAIRFVEGPKKNIAVKFTVTNHSDADATGLAGTVKILARTQKSEEDAVGTFSFTADVPAQASKEVTAPLSTKLKMYELPDWQNVFTDVQITAPQ